MRLEDLSWHRVIGKLVDKLDDDSFWLCLVRFLKTKIQFQTWVVVLYSNDKQPLILAASTGENERHEKLLKDYCNGLYLLDPFYIFQCKRHETQVLFLDDVAPDDFINTEYFNRYFYSNVVTDEVQLNIELDKNTILALSMGSQHAYDNHEIGLITLMQQWLIPLMRQRFHFETLYNKVSGTDAETVPSVNFSAFSDERLTEREQEVSQLMLSGCSAKSIASRLDISIETVRSHKRNLYQKLDINSQSELFALFWTAHVD